MAKQRKPPTLLDLTENHLEWTSEEPESMAEGREFIFRCPYHVNPDNPCFRAASWSTRSFFE